MSTIYIVFGSAGEYSDRREWTVEAHTTEEAAQARIRQLDALVQEFGLTGGYQGRGYEQELALINGFKSHPHGDQNFQTDYTGTSYYYGSCELVTP